MNTTPPIPGVRSRSAALAIGIGLSVGLIAVVHDLWLSLFARLAGGFLFALLWLLVGAIFRRGFRWFFSRQALRFHGCAVAGGVSLIVLFYVEEGWRGKRAWAALQRDLVSRGEKLDLASVTPPAVPDDQNLAMAPVMARWLNYVTNGAGGVRMSSGRNAEAPSLERDASGTLVRTRYGMPVPKTPQATWLRQEFTDLTAWQKYYRRPYEAFPWSVTSNRFVTRLTEPQFPVAQEAQTPARDVLLALSKFDAVLDELARAATERPLARYPHAYEIGYFAHTGSHQTLNDVVRVLCLRAVARMDEGQIDDAFADVDLAFRLADSPRSEPWLHSHFSIRHPMLTEALQPVWEGLARHQWTEPQLAALQQHFAGLDLLAERAVALRGEAVMQADLIQHVRRLATGQTRKLNPLREDPQEVVENFWVFVLRRFYPVGWLYQDEVLTYRFLQPFDTISRSGKPPAALRLSSIMDPFFVTFVLPKLRMIRMETETRFPHLQTLMNQALLACALERYRLAHGQFPESLDGLAPQFVAKVSRDVASGQPFRYRRTDDGQFILYALGADGVDDGGQPIKVEFDWSGSLVMPAGSGDWVWSSAPAGRSSTETQRR